MTNKAIEHLVNGYHRMAERLAERLQSVEHLTEEAFRELLGNLRDESVSLKELTKTEAQQVSDWLKRDFHALAEQARKTKQDFRDWFPFEVKVEESYLWDKIMSAADPTTLDLLVLKEEAELADFELWHTGQVTAPGILECTKCGEQLHFASAGHIPPCPKCKNTTFARILSAESDGNAERPES